jgi:hypothetical protein
MQWLYSWRGFSRILLWVFLILILGFVIFKKVLFSHHIPEFLKSSLKEHSVLKPEIYSLDQEGDPVKVQADYMLKKNSHEYFISMPLAQIDKKNGLFLNAKGEEGMYMPHQSILHLKGSVELWDHEKMHIASTNVSIYFKEKKALSHEAVSGKGPMGSFRGTGFQAKDNQLTIHGPCEIIIFDE